MTHLRWTMAAAALAWLAAGAVPGAVAQDKPTEEAPPAEDRPVERPKEPATPGDQKPKEGPLKAAAGTDGFALQSDGGDYKLQLKGLLQFDGRFFPSDKDHAATDTFLVRRARPILQGSAGRYFEFNLTPDFGEARSSSRMRTST